MALVSAAVGILAIRLPRRWVLLESCLFDSLNLNRFQVARQAAWPEYAPALLSIRTASVATQSQARKYVASTSRTRFKE